MPILKYMGISHLFSIILRVVSDLRLVLSCVAVLLYVNFVFYVARYRRKKKFRKKPFIRINTGAASSSSSGGGAQTDTASTEGEKISGEDSVSDAASFAGE